MSNKLTDLNNHLFAQLERLNNPNLKEGKLIEEIERSRAVGNIAREIINNGRLMLDSKKHFDAVGIKTEHQPELLKISGSEDNDKI